jgi:hypothetical protein
MDRSRNCQHDTMLKSGSHSDGNAKNAREKRRQLFVRYNAMDNWLVTRVTFIK